MKNVIRIIGYILAIYVFASCTDDIEATEPPIQATISISGTLPVMYIETENRQPVVSKEKYMNATYWLDPMGNPDVEPLGTE